MTESIAAAGGRAGRGWEDSGAAGAGNDVEPWSAAQAQAWRHDHPSVSVWRVVAVQALVGLVCAGVVAAVTRNGSAAWSALYGAAAVVLPAALLARGMTRGTVNPVAAAAGFLFWESLKVGVAIAMLVIASRVVPNLSWPALLLTMVVCIKVHWLALRWRVRKSNDKANEEHGS
jgi:ATP synthase protein I